MTEARLRDMSEPGVRASDADRDRVVQRLQRAFTEGRLTSEEMDERLESALTAASHGDLMAAVDGLPDELMDDVVELRSTGGSVKRAGEWRVPRLLRVDSTYGGVKLDLSEAVIEHPEIEIQLHVRHGSATILLPPGATADANEALSEWGSVTCKVPGRRRPGRLHVRIIGELTYGSLKVRHRRRWFGTPR
ncbi:DUF1707 domain-containing protein [Planotetraspora phitsanulokensis]|uniref:DUF1707 domain-containing protein n=1 Tax=Planotetraspora phitsanulokensis TaxID=575192 RepID=A0A8J3U4C2_9ACTN|nr:DUF1707 domain-containing protein [Planotetraspora phitsanulokensis]GII35834.1 hypothetical protein Pph01_08370 [Planotetraspora phitsanulokensis]